MSACMYVPVSLRKRDEPMRLITTLDLAMTALIELSSFGLYFIGTICMKQKLYINQLNSTNQLYYSNFLLAIAIWKLYLAKVTHELQMPMRILRSTERNKHLSTHFSCTNHKSSYVSMYLSIHLLIEFTYCTCKHISERMKNILSSTSISGCFYYKRFFFFIKTKGFLQVTKVYLAIFVN